MNKNQRLNLENPLNENNSSWQLQKANKALRAAKELESQQIEAGARYKRIGKTIVLVKS